MSLSDAWAHNLDNVSLTYLYRILNRLIICGELLASKGEQDTAWAVKDEYERRKAAGEAVF